MLLASATVLAAPVVPSVAPPVAGGGAASTSAPAAPAAPATPAAPPAGIAIAPPPPARLPGFAAELAQGATIVSPTGWPQLAAADAMRAVVHGQGIARQRARWNFARSLIARGRGADALGVLDTMVIDDPDLAMVDNWRLAHGAAQVLTGHAKAARAELEAGQLPINPEGCAWRLRASVATGDMADALVAADCARPAIAARPIGSRKPFLVAAAQAAVESGKPQAALSWAAALPDRDAEANLYRGRALGLLGQAAPARLRLDRALESGGAQVRADAALAKVELAARNHWIRPAAAIRELDAIRYEWRGDAIEERALRLGYSLAVAQHDTAAALRNGATLFRFFDTTQLGTDFVPGLQAQLAAAVDPAGSVPIDKAAGLFWDYRDLLPGGEEGDRIVGLFGARLQAAGLYERAAQLFEYRLVSRPADVTQGPLSVKVATLYILAGRPDRALTMLRRTANADYPDTMLVERKQVEAVALDKLGRPLEAFAVLQDVPDAGAIRAEIAWKRQDWKTLAAETEDGLPGPGALAGAGQAMVLRRAIALAMLHRDRDLAGLNARYRGAFARLPSGPVFAALTAAPGTVQPADFARAMAAIPSASPAGDIGALIEAGH